MAGYILAVTGQKGGTGKTTTAVNLSAALAELGRRVLLIDLDGQGSASRWLSAADDGAALLDVLRTGRRLADIARPSSVPGVDVVPCGPLFGDGPLVADAALRDELAAAIAGARDLADVVVIDCPPSLGEVALVALKAADGVIAPIDPAALTLDALPRLLATLGGVQRRRPDGGPRLIGLLLNRHDARQIVARQVADSLREGHAAGVFTTVIRESVRHREAPAYGRSILAYDATGPGAADFRALAVEVVERIKQGGA